MLVCHRIAWRGLVGTPRHCNTPNTHSFVRPSSAKACPLIGVRSTHNFTYASPDRSRWQLKTQQRQASTAASAAASATACAAAPRKNAAASEHGFPAAVPGSEFDALPSQIEMRCCQCSCLQAARGECEGGTASPRPDTTFQPRSSTTMAPTQRCFTCNRN